LILFLLLLTPACGPDEEPPRGPDCEKGAAYHARPCRPDAGQ
jgi:hypothetical protein